MITYTFIAVNYNNSEFSLKYIESIKRLTVSQGLVEVILVDNNSESDDYSQLSAIANRERNVTLIKNQNNLGYFGALNVGLASVSDKKDRILIVGNNDLEFEQHFIAQLDKVHYDGTTLAIAPNIITRNGYHQNPHCVGRVSLLRKLGYRAYFSNYYVGKLLYWITQKFKLIMVRRHNNACDEPLFIYMGIGACYVLTSHFFERYERLDDRVFLWGEEALFAGQVAAVGGKILYEPRMIVYHSENGSVGEIPSKKAYNITKQSYKIYSKYL